MNLRKGFGLFFAVAVAAVSLTGCETGKEMLHYMQPYQWGKLNRGIGGLGPEGYTNISTDSTVYFASITDDDVRDRPAVARKPLPESPSNSTER